MKLRERIDVSDARTISYPTRLPLQHLCINWVFSLRDSYDMDVLNMLKFKGVTLSYSQTNIV